MFLKSQVTDLKFLKRQNANAHVVGNTEQKAKKSYVIDVLRHSMLNLSTPVTLSFVFETIGAIFVVIGLCVYLVNVKTKKLKSIADKGKKL